MSILDDAPLVDDMAEKCAAELRGTIPANWPETIYGYMVRLVEQAEPAAHAAERARVVAVIEASIASNKKYIADNDTPWGWANYEPQIEGAKACVGELEELLAEVSP